MKLLIVRHAVAMDKEEFHHIMPNDELRPLTNDGSRRMKKNAKGLAQLVDDPDFLVTSPLVRAVQTTQILNDVWTKLTPVKCDALKPGSEPEELVTWLRSRSHQIPPHGTVVIVGHEPHLSSLISWFLTGSQRSLIEMKKGGACLLDFESQIVKARGQMKWLLTPKQLR